MATRMIERFYPELKFGGFTRVDLRVEFYMRIHSLLKETDTVLNIGCGPNNRWLVEPVKPLKDLMNLKGHCEKVIGIDIDEVGHTNPTIGEFRLIEGDRWPVEDESIDLCFADYVLEHIEKPEVFFDELKRILKPGGYACFRTPNLLSYFGIVSRFIPNRLHLKLVQKVQDHRQQVYHTYYRCNTKNKLKRFLKERSFEPCIYPMDGASNYLSFSRITYWFGVMLQRHGFEAFRINLLIFARKAL